MKNRFISALAMGAILLMNIGFANSDAGTCSGPDPSCSTYDNDESGCGSHTICDWTPFYCYTLNGAGSVPCQDSGQCVWAECNTLSPEDYCYWGTDYGHTYSTGCNWDSGCDGADGMCSDIDSPGSCSGECSYLGDQGTCESYPDCTWTPDNPAPGIGFKPPTPNDGSSTSNLFFPVNVTVDDNDLMGNFTWRFNGTNVTLYDDNLMLMLNMDNRASLGENSSTFKDSSKSGGDFSCSYDSSCTPTSSGVYYGALAFDGVQPNPNYITRSGSSATRDTYTFSMWIKPYPKYGSGEAARSLFFNFGGLGCNQYAEMHSNGQLQWTHGTSPYTAVYSAALAPFGAWTHYAVTWDGTTMKDYLNGSYDNTGSGTAPFVYAGGNTYIGCIPCSEVYIFNGSIDEVRVWNRTLSAAEIRQVYLSNLAKFNSTHWEFLANETGLAAGTTYYYNATACDLGGLCNSTELRSITTGGGTTVSNLFSNVFLSDWFISP